MDICISRVTFVKTFNFELFLQQKVKVNFWNRVASICKFWKHYNLNNHDFPLYLIIIRIIIITIMPNDLQNYQQSFLSAIVPVNYHAHTWMITRMSHFILLINKLKSLKVAKCRKARMNKKWWRQMKDEWRMMKDDDFKFLRGFGNWQRNGRTLVNVESLSRLKTLIETNFIFYPATHEFIS